jgi:hypothetical protein
MAQQFILKGHHIEVKYNNRYHSRAYRGDL